MARGATFDLELEEQVGEAIGKELVSLGGNAFGGVCVNLLRHPAWGRAQETFGEDTLHVSLMGSRTVRGVEKYAAAIVKHFALNSMENARFRVDVRIEERALHEIYLRHFKRIICEEKCSFVMSSYNQVNGDFAGENESLLTEILKKRWGFEGAVMTDFVFGLRDAKKSIMAGQDLEMPFRQTFNRYLPDLVAKGQVPMSRVNDAVLRLLRVQSRERQPVNGFSDNEHSALALRVARESIVLIQNEASFLPLGKDKKIALIGKLASIPNTGDHGSSNTQPRHVITCEEGIKTVFGSDHVFFADGSNASEVNRLAHDCEVCVVVVGYTYLDEGEYVVPNLDKRELALFPPPGLKDVSGILRIVWQQLWQRFVGSGEHQVMGVGGDRKSLALNEKDEALIDLVSKVNKNVIVVVMSGSAFTCESWKSKVKSILCVWYPGQEGGRAVAEILSGDVNPSGKLPSVFPKRWEDLPYFDRNAESIEYDYWHGYRKLERDEIDPAFPFGFGLTYTDFVLAKFRVKLNDDVSNQQAVALECTVQIQNVGRKEGDEVVQIYMSAIDSKVSPRPKKELIAFERVRMIKPGETRDVTLHIVGERMAYYDVVKQDYVIERCRYRLIAARHSLDSSALSAEVDWSSGLTESL